MRRRWCRMWGHRWTPYRLYGGDPGYSYLMYFRVDRCSRCKDLACPVRTRGWWTW